MHLVRRDVNPDRFRLLSVHCRSGADEIVFLTTTSAQAEPLCPGTLSFALGSCAVGFLFISSGLACALRCGTVTAACHGPGRLLREQLTTAWAHCVSGVFDKRPSRAAF